MSNKFQFPIVDVPNLGPSVCMDDIPEDVQKKLRGVTMSKVDGKYYYNPADVEIAMRGGLV